MTGCNEEMQKNANAHKERMQIEEHEQALRLQKNQFQHQKEMALAAGEHALRMKEKFYTFAAPVVSLMSVVGTIGWLWWYFMRLWAQWAKDKLVKEFRIAEVTQIQQTLRLKHEKILKFAADNLDRLSAGERKLMFEGLTRDQNLLADTSIIDLGKK